MRTMCSNFVTSLSVLAFADPKWCPAIKWSKPISVNGGIKNNDPSYTRAEGSTGRAVRNCEILPVVDRKNEYSVFSRSI